MPSVNERATAGERGKTFSIRMSKPLKFTLCCSLLFALLLASATIAVIRKAEESMAHLLGEKGASLLTVSESILRSGLRHEIGIRLQVLLEEMATSSDIVFAAVTMPDGTILAHSDPDRQGEVLEMKGHEVTYQDMQELAPSLITRWRFMELEGHAVFAVYRVFTPGLSSIPKGVPMPVIFLGLDPSPFEITRSQNRIYVSLLAGVSLLVLLAALAALVFAERARESRRRQEQAEGRVRSLEEEVRRKEKLAAVGSLAAGVAHEIRNPLSSIKGYATYFGQRFPVGSEDRACAEIMVSEVDRLNRVITDLIGLSKPSDIRLASFDPVVLVEGVARLIRNDARRQGVEVRVFCTRNMPWLNGDVERLHQALLNLCLNALDAMPNGGSLTIGACAGRSHLCLFVRDTGSGMAKDFVSHIFDPYFTTKATGTGLGLALVHKIADAHKASIRVWSRPKGEAGHGLTVFSILFDRGSEDGYGLSDSAR